MKERKNILKRFIKNNIKLKYSTIQKFSCSRYILPLCRYLGLKLLLFAELSFFVDRRCGFCTLKSQILVDVLKLCPK